MKNSGFTLLELSIVLLIASMLATFSVGIGKFFLEQNKIRATQIKLRTIANALDIYLIQHDKLPCPAGLKKSTGTALTSCSSSNVTEGVYVNNSVARGWVPYEELDLTNDVVYDEWNSKIVYSVPIAMLSNFSKLNDNFDGISVYNDSKSELITNEAIYTLVSHGKNGLGAFDKKGNQKSDTGISSLEKTNVAASSLSNSDEFIYFTKKTCDDDDTKKCDDLGRYATKMQVVVDNDIKEISCYIGGGVLGDLATKYGCDFSAGTYGNYLPYGASINSAGSDNCDNKYKLICLKYGQLEVMQNDY